MIFKRVKQYCTEHSMSISAFEKKCGIGNGTVSRWENDNSKPSLPTLEKIEKVTGIPIHEWIMDTTDEKGGY